MFLLTLVLLIRLKSTGVNVFRAHVFRAHLFRARLIFSPARCLEVRGLS
jgi:hypothetical protein